MTVNSLTDEQKRVFDAAMSRQNLIVTGGAGTGKSHLIRTITDALRAQRKQVAVTAPTGIAAINIEGRTLQGLMTDFATIQELDVLIVDEVSMVSSLMLYDLDRTLRFARDKRLTFGGIQVLLIGDLAQLQPVVVDGSAEHRKIRESFAGVPYFHAVCELRASFKHLALTTIVTMPATNEKKSVWANCSSSTTTA